MKRRLIRTTLLCLALGAIMTVTIAWIGAWWRPLPRDWPALLMVDDAGETWIGFGAQGPGWKSRTIYGAPLATAYGRSLAEPLPSWMQPQMEGALDARAVEAVAAGWPFACLVARRTGVGHEEPPPGRGWHTGMGPQWVEWRPWHGAIALADDATARAGARGRGSILPFGMFATGFAANTLFWSLPWPALWLLLYGRAAWRRRHGRCLKCGYDLQGQFNAGCPECGWNRDQFERHEQYGV